ncbi:tRNA nuclease WapA precursor [Thalassoglobus neptunius]|uniref:tRNA nuclease WapA n=2 Tax=Thalassoglobus neptunius TaxID=1938619 RepID=A0A5C5UUN4_9PLAN|nr:tRNA nuclease WapA precursor [Thalassoglobus neptunius]
MDDGSFTAGYDDEDRLTSWDRSNSDDQDWSLSLVGDWNSFNESGGGAVSRTHNDVHELTAIGANSLTYDAKGNLLTDADNHTYVWDFDNHLQQATTGSSSVRGIEGTHTYEYDALGRRVAKVVNDDSGMTTVVTRTIYINSYELLPPLSSVGGQVLAEYEKVGAGSTNLARTYTYGEYVDEPLSITDHSSTPVTYYYHHNRVFNVVGLTDISDNVIELYTYTPYGTVDIRDPSDMSTRSTSSYGNTYAFTGRRLDHETGLHYFRARYMDSTLGRFIGRDPYRYVNGSGLYNISFAPTGVDPSGGAICKCTTTNFSATGYGGSATSRTAFHYTKKPCSELATSSYSSFGGSGCGYSRKCSPLTNDEQTAIDCCEGDPECEKALATLMTQVKNTPRPGPYNRCFHWMDNFIDAYYPSYEFGFPANCLNAGGGEMPPKFEPGL